MGLLEDVGKELFVFDTAPLIYFVERHPDFHGIVRPLFAAVAGGELESVASTVTLLEVLVGAFKKERADLATQYEEILLGSEHVTIRGMPPEIAREAAHIRAAHGLKTPDAIIAATTSVAGATTLIANDPVFRRVTGLRVLLVSDYIVSSSSP